MWTRELLCSLMAEQLRDFHLICIANREPYMHVATPHGVHCQEPASGVVTALDPVMRATGGTWVAHGSGSADRETADAHGRLRVPVGRPRYTLRRVWLTKEEEAGYYYGFANEGLWPLCHIAYQRPVFEEQAWRQYAAVNEKFADAVLEELNGHRPLVFIQDYHFSLLPKLVKQRLPNAIVFQFWHIPWPNPEVFRICPWKGEILEGLLGNDLLAFHTQFHCNNFLDTVDRELESRVDRERFCVTLRGSDTLVRPHPISIDFESVSELASTPECAARLEELRGQLRLDGKRVILGVDRLDYTKGIPERIRAFDRFLERRPEMRGRVVLLQLGMPSRTSIRTYHDFQDDVERQIEDVNRRYETPGWTPVVYLKGYHEHPDLYAYYRLADVCLVTSLHDGMNLVAKEFVACRSDREGVLVLSEFTGAARELTHAILVNPFAVDAVAEALHAALALSPVEQAARMDRMRQAIQEQNVYKWVGKLLQQAARLETGATDLQPAPGTDPAPNVRPFAAPPEDAA